MHPPLVERRPTRVETVSAFVWKCFMIASAEANKNITPESSHDKSNSKTYLVTHGVNMRRKNEPPFPDNSFGNFVWLVPATSSSNNEHDRDLENLFTKVRSAIGKVDTEFVKRMRGENGFSGYLKNLEDSWREFHEDADYLAISSWCNFGLYVVDFRWGGPAWITTCAAGSDVESPFINVLWLMDTKKGDGIEAWLTMDEKYFAEFDKIQEVRDLARVDPSPLDFAWVERS